MRSSSLRFRVIIASYSFSPSWLPLLAGVLLLLGGLVSSAHAACSTVQNEHLKVGLCYDTDWSNNPSLLGLALSTTGGDLEHSRDDNVELIYGSTGSRRGTSSNDYLLDESGVVRTVGLSIDGNYDVLPTNLGQDAVYSVFQMARWTVTKAVQLTNSVTGRATHARVAVSVRNSSTSPAQFSYKIFHDITHGFNDGGQVRAVTLNQASTVDFTRQWSQQHQLQELYTQGYPGWHSSQIRQRFILNGHDTVPPQTTYLVSNQDAWSTGFAPIPIGYPVSTSADLYAVFIYGPFTVQPGDEVSFNYLVGIDEIDSAICGFDNQVFAPPTVCLDDAETQVMLTIGNSEQTVLSPDISACVSLSSNLALSPSTPQACFDLTHVNGAVGAEFVWKLRGLAAGPGVVTFQVTSNGQICSFSRSIEVISGQECDLLLTPEPTPTPIVPTNTPTPTSTRTSTPTSALGTPTPTATPTSTRTPPGATATPTPTPVSYAPVIIVAGYLDTVADCAPWELNLYALVTDLDFTEPLRVELYYDRQPTGLFLSRESLTEFRLRLPLDAAIPEGRYRLQLRASDGSGNESALWPELPISSAGSFLPQPPPDFTRQIAQWLHREAAQSQLSSGRSEARAAIGNAPVLALAGYGGSVVDSQHGGSLTLVAMAADADGDLSEVQVLYSGLDTGLRLSDQGGGVFALPSPLLLGPLPPGDYPIELEAMDLAGNRSRRWPYLEARPCP